MRVAIRTDASIEIGTGHVMRCLTLADALRAGGAECRFISREHPGHLIDHVRARGYVVDSLSLEAKAPVGSQGYAAWLGASQELDAARTVDRLGGGEVVDWLVVDHYGLDERWESLLRPCCERLMVIDDLADRGHQCDLLMDQTWGRSADDYRPRVPAACSVLCGSDYALLRPEFALQRAASLDRRSRPASALQLLITLGGVDKTNVTSAVLRALADSDLPEDARITVVMGAGAPWLDAVRDVASCLPWQVDVRAGVSDMARIMADADLAIGAAGATSWERCCLGLPTVMVVLADNQIGVASGLAQAGAARVITDARHVAAELPALVTSLVRDPAQLHGMSTAASRVVDGQGASRVINQMVMAHGSH